MKYLAYVEQLNFRRVSGGTPDTTLNPYKTMNADQFVEKIQELRQLSLDDPTSRRLIITKKSAVSPLFDDPLLDLLHRYDLSKIEWGISFEDGIFEMDLMDDEDNVRFNQLYYYIGSFNEGWFVISKETQEVIDVSVNDVFMEMDNTYWYLAKNSVAFLDTLYLDIEYYYSMDRTQDFFNNHILNTIESSGGLKYARFWIEWLGDVAERYNLALPDL